jgi:ribonuclease J
MRIVPLGGFGEFGANCVLLEDDGGERLLIDAGAAFSDLEPFGVSYEVPDFAALGGPAPLALVCTHGHDDHVKAVAFVREAYPGVPVVASLPTLERLRTGLGQTFAGPKVALEMGKPLRLGPWLLAGLSVSHSLPGAMLLRVKASEGTLVVATDFRLAPSALDEETSREALAEWGDGGVDVVLLDSTNALVRTSPPAEAAVAETIAGLAAEATGAVVGVTFASHVGRFRQFARAAVAAGRLAVPVGRGLVEALETYAGSGGLGLPPGSVRPARELVRLPRERVVVVATGSQGEDGSAFSRLAVDALPGFKLAAGDLVLHAARVIPGSERRLAHLFDHCARRGARVVTAADAPIHASGHPHVAELEETLRLLRPRWVVPMHGRRRNLEELAALARRLGHETLVVENGWEVSWREGRLQDSGERRGLGRMLLEEMGEGVLDPAVLRHRRFLARDGVVVALLTCRCDDEAVLGEPQIFASGMVLEEGERTSLATGLAGELRRAPWASRRDAEALRSTMTRWLRSELRRKRGRRPVVLALVVEL